ncbi:hypothetical protein B0H16DRAFT_1448289 [Mycena metata]|uniref:Uncharacterized protein n=1 Tax=Mycena metata TaxID=1033252 RepID=A0AAD7K9M7_9AGAR|nr:hypothetical protein B0H16DRAFT_1448289 [Mycena metata]
MSATVDRKFFLLAIKSVQIMWALAAAEVFLYGGPHRTAIVNTVWKQYSGWQVLVIIQSSLSQGEGGRIREPPNATRRSENQECPKGLSAAYGRGELKKRNRNIPAGQCHDHRSGLVVIGARRRTRFKLGFRQVENQLRPKNAKTSYVVA